MRNIKIIQKIVKPGVLTSGGGGKNVIICAEDDSSLLICEGGILKRFRTENGDVEVLCNNAGEVLEDLVGMQFVRTTGVTYLVNGRGSFLQMGFDNQVEELFQSEEGIVRFAVSPDSRFAAIVTKEMTMLLLTLPDLEVVSQHSLAGEESYLGVNIVWREDSLYFGVNFNIGERYRIKIFDDSGNLHSQTEEENSLIDSIIEWQPSGGLIAGVGTSPHGTTISLFERNGLKRADFYPYTGRKFNYEANKIEKLIWNPTSDILAVVYHTSVELWCRNNYLWMRKVTLQSPSPIIFTSWERESSNRLQICDQSGILTSHDVTFTYTTGYAGGAAMVASWSGNSVFSTPFRDSCCPPPDCLHQTTFEADVESLIIPEFWSGFAVVTSSQIHFCHYSDSILSRCGSVTISDPGTNSQSWLWPNTSTFCSINSASLQIFQLGNFSLPDIKTEDVSVTLKTISFDSPVISLYPAGKHIQDTFIICQLSDGTILKVSLLNGTSTKLCKFPQPCAHIDLLSDSLIIGHNPISRKIMVSWSIYPNVDPVTLNNDTLSFVTFQTSLIFTTIQGSLEILSEEHLTQQLENHILGKPSPSQEGRYTRKCEKGSVIVTCCLNKMLEPSLVLQVIPRGNLEIIYPRPLVIASVQQTLREKEDNSRYEKIMTSLRRHRIDYRVLIDEMRALIKEQEGWRLEECLKTMIEQVKNSHSLVLLVTDLNQDYGECILAIKNILEGVIGGAVERQIHVEESYLAAMAKLGLLEEALKSSLILGEGDGNRELVKNRIKFLSFYCENPDTLWDTALGTYDLSLAVMVADCLGKDPKEYVPVLEGLKECLEWKRRFKIDDKLRRYGKAVVSLVRDGRVMHEEIVKYMERHRLFSDVIGFLGKKIKSGEGGVVERSGDDMGLLSREAKESFARYLEERGKTVEAGILYREAGNLEKAVDCGVKGGDWEFAIQVGYEKGGEEEVKKIGVEVIKQLEEKRMYEEAGRVCESYLDDWRQALGFYLKGRRWQTAATICAKRPELGEECKEEMVRKGILSAAQEMKESAENVMEDLHGKVKRWRKVKELKAEKAALTGGIGDEFSDTESFLSGSSSTGSIASSNASGKSYRSAKNKRKHERKVYSLKEGSKHEDLAIVAYIWGVVDKLQEEIKVEISATLESLWKFGETEMALGLGDSLDKLVHKTDKIVSEVWATPLTDEILETKFRIAPISWTPAICKLALHEPSSKASSR